MIFKFAAAFLPLLFSMVSLYAVDKWNIQLANFLDLSRLKDKNTGMTLQRSVSSQLARQNGFNLVQGKTNIFINNFKDALNAGRAYKADVILYGDYYIDGEDLVIVIDVFDVLENRLKMRKYYSGKVDLDIFDTIDSMAADMVKKIKEALPELTSENQARVRQVRQSIYETEKITIKRVFYTRLGFQTELGPKQFFTYNGSNSMNYGFPNPGIGNTLLFSNVPIGFAFRFWEFRLDLLFSGLPGLPAFAWQLQDHQYVIWNEIRFPGNFFNGMLSFYLPWFNNSLAVGVGMQYFDILYQMKMDTSGGSKNIDYAMVTSDENTSGGSPSGTPIVFGLIWNPTPDLEFSLAVNPFMETAFSYHVLDKNSGISQGTNYVHFWRDFPALTLDAILFLGNFGLELRATADSYHYSSIILQSDGSTNFSTSHNGGGGIQSANSTLVSLYAGFVYRVDFLK
jgi:hypothetical protein